MWRQLLQIIRSNGGMQSEMKYNMRFGDKNKARRKNCVKNRWICGRKENGTFKARLAVRGSE